MEFDADSRLRKESLVVCLECSDCPNIGLINADGLIDAAIPKPIFCRIDKTSALCFMPSLWLLQIEGVIYEVALGESMQSREVTAELGMVKISVGGINATIGWPFIRTVREKSNFLGGGYEVYAEAPELDPEGALTCVVGRGLVQSCNPTVERGQFLADSDHSMYWIWEYGSKFNGRDNRGIYSSPFWYGSEAPFDNGKNQDVALSVTISLIRLALSS